VFFVAAFSVAHERRDFIKTLGATAFVRPT